VRVLYTKLKMSMYLQRRKMKYKSVRQSFHFSCLIVHKKLYKVFDDLFDTAYARVDELILRTDRIMFPPSFRRWTKSSLILLLLFGIHYSLFLPLSYYHNHKIELIWLFCDQMFASFQVSIVPRGTCVLLLMSFVFAGYFRGLAILSAKQRSQNGGKTCMENTAIEEVYRLFHLQSSGIIENFARRKRHRPESEVQSVGSNLPMEIMAKSPLKEFK